MNIPQKCVGSMPKFMNVFGYRVSAGVLYRGEFPHTSRYVPVLKSGPTEERLQLDNLFQTEIKELHVVLE